MHQDMLIHSLGDERFIVVSCGITLNEMLTRNKSGCNLGKKASLLKQTTFEDIKLSDWVFNFQQYPVILF